MDETPKVLMIGPAFSGGGAEGRFSRIAGLVAHGTADIAVLVLPQGAQAPGQGALIDLGWRGRGSYLSIIWQLAGRIRQHRYDVVMGFGLFPNLIAVCASRLSRLNVPVVVHEISRPLQLLAKSGWLKRTIYIGMQRLILSRAQVLTANSIDGLAELQRICPGFDGPTMRLENAMDTAQLQQRLAEAPDLAKLLPERYVVCVARLDWMKRFDTVIAAFAQIADHSAVGLVIVGDGEARQALADQAAQTGLADRIIFTGSLANPMGVVCAAEALVIASEYEGFSNATLEAMLLKTPVVTSYCSSDAREMVEMGAALGFEVGDAEGLARQLKAVLSTSDLAQSLVRTAEAYAARHAVAPSVARYDDVLRDAAMTKH